MPKHGKPEIKSDPNGPINLTITPQVIAESIMGNALVTPNFTLEELTDLYTDPTPEKRTKVDALLTEQREREMAWLQSLGNNPEEQMKTLMDMVMKDEKRPGS